MKFKAAPKGGRGMAVLGIFKFSTQSDIKLEKIYDPGSFCKSEFIDTPKKNDKVPIFHSPTENHTARDCSFGLRSL
jgi:hypothetical protein